MAAEAAVSSVVQILGDLLIQKVNSLRGVEKQVQWLKDELKRMQCFLKDAAEKQANNERVRNWISEIREVAHDAQDAIEIFILKVENARSSGLLRRSACFLNHVYYVNKVGEEIESIRKRLEEIDKSRERYGIQDLSEAMASSRRSEEVESLRRLAPWKNDQDVVGLEEDVNLLLERAILDGKKGLSSATLIGMGGIGKSTLARKVYNNAAVTAQFERRGWVVVSSQFSPREVIKELMVQLLKPTEDKLKVLETMEKLAMPSLLQMLHEQLQGTRYLIVVDDVWEDAHWEAIADAFPDEDKGSRLLLTSRNRVISEYTPYVHPMKLLEPDESWKLLLKKALIDGKCPEDLENIGRQIVSKCNGLPLAIRVVGGLLIKQRQTKSEWEKVLKGINSHLGRSESNVSAILELSYQNLPPRLKPCFLCLAFFEEDAIIRVQKLVNIWIAQGFIPQEGEETMEEIAMSYLHDLINRNMIQVKDMKKYGKIKNCQMHDLIHELSITKAKEEMRFEIPREEGTSQSSHKSRHCSIYFSNKRFTEYSANQTKHLRSLFIHGDGYGSPSVYWKSFELLRVLDLEGCRLSKLPGAICGLIELRYLGLRHTGLINELPRSLGKLRNLLVLDLWTGWHVRIPNVIWKMASLRHFYSYHLLCNVPLKLSTLKNIQTLSCIPLNDANIEQITQMTSLCKLGIDIEKISNVSKLFTSLAKLEHLISLNLGWCGSLNMEGLGTLHRITQLKLDRLNRLPCNFPPNLLHLSLVFAYMVEEDPMPVLEKLPKLMYLKLNSAYRGHEIVISHDGFPMLKVLRLMNLQISNIQIGKGAMPELKQLEIVGCWDLERLPEEVKAMHNLEELKMVTTAELASKLRGEDSQITSNIPSVHIIVEPLARRVA